MKHNILFIESGTGWGGSSSYLHSFLKYFDREKFNPLVFLYRNGEGPFVKEIRKLGIKIFYFKKQIKRQRQIVNNKYETNFVKKTIRQKTIKKIPEKTIMKTMVNLSLVVLQFTLLNILILVKIRKIIKKEKIELIFLNNDVHYHIPGILAAKLTQLPCVCRKAGIGGGKKYKKVFSRFVDVFIASSNAALQDHIQNKFPYKKIVMIYEGVDLEKYKPSNNRNKIRRELGIHPETKVVGTVSRIVNGKGLPELIEAASLVLKEHPDAIFLIVGDEPNAEGILHKQLQQQIISYGLDKNIIFTGWRNDIPDILSAIDIYAQPSVYPEGLCIAALESQACGKPAVVTNAGGLAETTADDITGFVTPIDDPYAFAKNIMRLIEDEKMAIARGINAQDRIKKKFDIKNNVKRTEQLLIDLLENTP